MKLLEERILRDGVIKPGGVLKIDSFLNHQIDMDLIHEMALEFKRIFGNDNVTKILTIEASGIAIAAMTGYEFGCPILFAKKSKTSNISSEVYASEVASFTHGNTNTVIVSKEYLHPEDRILIVDDFLANGAALTGLIDLCTQAGAYVVGAGIAVEKVFQNGGNTLRSKGVRIASLAKIVSMSDSCIEFED